MKSLTCRALSLTRILFVSDGVTYQLRRYTEGDISMERLIEELKYSKGLTIQYYFGTERALSYLKRL